MRAKPSKTAPQGTIIVFVKAPAPGLVKTRLCPPLSPAQAAALYAAFVKDTLQAALDVPGTQVEIAYDAAAPFLDLGWLPGGFTHFLQEGAGLGARLIHAFNRAFLTGAENVVVIGSDMPHLEPKSIARAFALLAKKDVVLGPASDGGYYLIGLKRPAPSLFDGISWSSDKVFEETTDRIRQNRLRLGTLPKKSDVDTGADLEALAKDLSRKKEGTARFTRRALSKWSI